MLNRLVTLRSRARTTLSQPAPDVLARKLRLERLAYGSFKPVLLGLVADWGAAAARRGHLDPGPAQRELSRRLLTHYARVALAFRDPAAQIRPSPDLEAAVVEPSQAERLRERASRNAGIITGTVVRDLETALAAFERREMATALASIVDGAKACPTCGQASATSLEAKADRVGLKMRAPKGATAAYISSMRVARRKLGTRLESIANTETQGIAEESRLLVVGNDQATHTILKVWTSLLDGRERPAHNLAHGQERRVEEPYNVGAEALRFPGDFALGASLWNIINCRCSSEFRIEGDDDPDPFLRTPRLTPRRPHIPGDDAGIEQPAVPTTAITLGGEKVTANVVLDDGTFAILRRRADRITIHAGGRLIGEATITANPAGILTLSNLRGSAAHRAAIQRLLADTVAATNRLRQGELAYIFGPTRINPVAVSKLPVDTLYLLSEADQAAHLALDTTLNEDERRAVRRFTKADHLGINGWLRDGRTGMRSMSDGEAETLARTIQQAIHTRELPADVVLYRGVASRDPRRLERWLRPGSEVVERGFSASTTARTLIDRATDAGSDTTSLVIYARRGQKGLSVDNVTSQPGELEVVLPAGTVFRVIKVETQTRGQNSHRYVHVEIVQQEPSIDTYRNRRPDRKGADEQEARRLQRFVSDIDGCIVIDERGTVIHDTENRV